MSQADQYLVIGHPIAHSKSPFIHNAFAQQTGEPLQYTLLDVAVGEFAANIARLQQAGLKGCNVTMPFKEDAWQVADELSPYAQRARAVNTLMLREDGSIYGTTTDGSGLLRDLQHNLGLQLRAKRVLILGAGGAVRGVLEPLLSAQPAELFIANRTAAKATELASVFAEFGPVSGGGFNDIKQAYDLIINGTAAGFQGEMPDLPAGSLADGGACYDMMYAAEPTVFMRWAQAQGATLVTDGLGMLVEQAADAFALWRGVRPETAEVLHALRAGNDEQEPARKAR